MHPSKKHSQSNVKSSFKSPFKPRVLASAVRSTLFAGMLGFMMPMDSLAAEHSIFK
jgi:hypothetical protein